MPAVMRYSDRLMSSAFPTGLKHKAGSRPVILCGKLIKQVSLLDFIMRFFDSEEMMNCCFDERLLRSFGGETRITVIDLYLSSSLTVANFDGLLMGVFGAPNYFIGLSSIDSSTMIDLWRRRPVLCCR